ncbi:MAG: glycosyltransferase family 4 protein [Acidobacteriota bacterium]
MATRAMRILFLTPRPPWPIRRGDQVRAARLIAELARRHEVRVVTLRPPGFPPCAWPPGVSGHEVRQGWFHALAGLLSHLDQPIQVGLHNRPAFHRRVRRLTAEFRPEVAVVVLSRLGAALPALGATPVLLDLIDSLELNLANRAARQPLLGPLLRWEARRIGRWDSALICRAAHAVVISERDRSAILDRDPELEDRLSVLPAAVPVAEQPPDASPRHEVVILPGNLGYFPTVDGALWYAREVWPRLRSLRPTAEWWLAGARPARALRRLALLPGVRLLADPPDLARLIRGAAVAIAPLLAGSGTPNKVLEAMAEGTPVVTTPAGAEGLATAGRDAFRVAGDGPGFARAVADLLANPEAARAQATVAWQYLLSRHALPIVAAELEAILERIARRP